MYIKNKFKVKEYIYNLHKYSSPDSVTHRIRYRFITYVKIVAKVYLKKKKNQYLNHETLRFFMHVECKK